MSPALWISLVTAYPFVIALIIAWIRGATLASTPKPPALADAAGPRRSTMKVEAFGRQVARFEILEHLAPDGEILKFHIPPPETKSDWTVDQVADLAAAIDALPQAPELETR